MPPSPLASVGTAGNILLVEEYDALAVAFGATIRQLTPNHHTVVVGSLAAAEIAAAAAAPDLLVIDFDPPHPRAIGFFNRMKVSYPDARVMVIAANTWRDLPTERIGLGAFQFVEKPFDLPKFGSALHALLRPRTEPGAASTRGAIRDLDLIDMIALFGAAGVTTTLNVTAARGGVGAISFAGGQIVQAVVLGKSGPSALEEMLRWPLPRFEESETRAAPPRTIHGPWTSALRDALRSVRQDPLPPEPVRPIPEPAPVPDKQIVVIDDTDLLLIFVEDILRTARPTLGIATAMSGLEGLRRAAEILPDLILLDYSLPDITGDEVCRRLLEDPRTAQIPVLMMSGHVSEMAATAQLYPNVVATIGKPFLSSAWVELVEGTLSDVPKVISRPAVEIEPKTRKPARPARKTPTLKEKTVPLESIPAEAPSAAAISVPASEAPAEEVNGRHNGLGIVSERLTEPGAPPEDMPVTPAPAVESPSLHEHSLESWAVEREALTLHGPASPARIPEAKDNTVVLTLPLEVTSIQFSPSLQTKAIRAKPYSSTVTIHIMPEVAMTPNIAATAFVLDHVDLDARGQISTVRLMRSVHPAVELAAGGPLAVADLAALPGQGGGTMEVTPSAATPMRIQLLALFELVAVEFATDVSVEHLILKTRGAKVRLHMQPGTAHAGITFRNVQVLLDRSARIAEVLLDALE